MRIRTITIGLAMLCVATTAAAQGNCPMTRASEVPARGTLGPMRACDSGFQLEVEGVRLGNGSSNCPLFVVVTPTHHEAVACKEDTFAAPYDTVSEQIVYFDCTPRYFLFFRIDSTCDIRQIVNSGSLQLLETRRCFEEATVP